MNLNSVDDSANKASERSEGKEMAERRLNNRGQNQDDNAVPAAIRNSNMSEECIILLEELIRSNRALASENEICGSSKNAATNQT